MATSKKPIVHLLMLDGSTKQRDSTLAVGSGLIGLSGKTFSLDIDGMTDIGAALVDAGGDS